MGCFSGRIRMCPKVWGGPRTGWQNADGKAPVQLLWEGGLRKNPDMLEEKPGHVIVVKERRPTLP